LGFYYGRTLRLKQAGRLIRCVQESSYDYQAHLAMKSNFPRRGALWMVAAGASLWGTDTMIRAPLTLHLSSATIVFIEHLILGIALFPVLWFTRKHWLAFSRYDWLAAIGIAWGGSALASYLFTDAVRMGNPTTAVLLQKSQPIFAALLSGVILSEPLGFPFWSRLAVALAGAYLVNFGSYVPHAPSAGRGSLLALAAAGLWGASTVLGRFLLLRISFLILTALRILLALPPLAAAVWLEHSKSFVRIDAHQALSLLLLALVPGFAALMIYYYGLQHSSASKASVAELCFPLTAIVLNWYFLKIQVSGAQVVGFILLVAAIFSWDGWPRASFSWNRLRPMAVHPVVQPKRPEIYPKS
jgi:drug/metabolite transporter (DMT)-like permease